MDRIKAILLNFYYWQRIAEMGLLYFILPILILFELIPIPLLIVLAIMGTSVILFLRYDSTFDKKIYYKWRLNKKQFKAMLLFFMFSAIVMVVTIWIVDDSKLFVLLRKNPEILLITSIIYPLFSVIPQSLAYRVLFFHRYAPIIPSKWTQIVISAFFFSFGHVIYKSFLVMFLTFIAGLIFAYRYYKTKSLWLSVIEHAMYGLWLFFSGLGIYFMSSLIY